MSKDTKYLKTKSFVKEILLKQLNTYTPKDFVLYEETPRPRWTVFAEPNFNKKQLNKFDDFMQKVKRIEPNQILTTRKNLHITITYGNTKEENILKGLRYIKENYNDMEFDFSYLGTSSQAMGIHAIPLNYDIIKLRNMVNETLNIEKRFPMIGNQVPNANDLFISIGWIHFLRYINVPKQEYLEFLRKNQDFSLGNAKIKNIKARLITDKLHKNILKEITI